MENKKTENCMICGEELAYLTSAIPVTCTYCGKAESANIHCPSGHYVCNECHSSDSIQIITQFCLSSSSKNPMEMAKTVILKASPLTDYERRTANMMTSRALAAIASNRGARCCKRSTYVALESAIQYFREVLGTELEYIPVSKLKCEHSSRNKTCSRTDCRFYAGKAL